MRNNNNVGLIIRQHLANFHPHNNTQPLSWGSLGAKNPLPSIEGDTPMSNSSLNFKNFYALFRV